MKKILLLLLLCGTLSAQSTWIPTNIDYLKKIDQDLSRTSESVRFNALGIYREASTTWRVALGGGSGLSLPASGFLDWAGGNARLQETSYGISLFSYNESNLRQGFALLGAPSTGGRGLVVLRDQYTYYRPYATMYADNNKDFRERITDNGYELQRRSSGTFSKIFGIDSLGNVTANNILTYSNYYADSLIVVTGTLDAGTVANLQAVGGTNVNVAEATTTGMQVILSTPSVTALTTISFYGYYSGGAGHTLSVQVFNITNSTWETIGTIGSTATAQWYSFPVFIGSNYINSGRVRTRLLHNGTGINTHDLYLDYFAVNYGGAGGSTLTNASSVTFIPTGTISSTNVQSAIAEVASEAGGTVAGFSGDSTITFAKTATRTQIQDRINLIPKDMNGYTLNLQFSDTTYSFTTGGLTLQQFRNGVINVKGKVTESGLHSNQAVVFSGASTGSGTAFLYFFGNRGCIINITNIKITTTSPAGGAAGINATQNPGSMIISSGMAFISDETANFHHIYSVATNIDIRVSYFTKGLNAIHATNSAYVFSHDNYTLTTAAAYGLRADTGATVVKSSTQPTGSTSNEATTNGGLIR